MKILWIVNTIFPYPSEFLGIEKNVFGGWLNGLLESLKTCKEVKLAIATVYSGKKMLKIFHEDITYYLIPGAPAIKYNKKLEHYWKKINDEFLPELVHIHGTEFAHGLAFQRALPNVKTIVSIQGLVSKCADIYYAGIGKIEILKNITFRDILKNDNIFQARKKFLKRGENEKESISRAYAILGRTIWDYAFCKKINSNLIYFKNNETLRKSFYNAKWDIEKIEKHSIFVTQGAYPLKGIHYAIRAISILKKEYPTIKLYIAGQNIIKNDTLIAKIKLSGYGKYIRKLIKKLNVVENVKFIGILDEQQILDRMLKSNIFLLPSALENSSNSLGEAMLLGMPCIASNTGGTMDILVHKKEGILYPYGEYEVLAYYISEYFKNNSFITDMGQNARKKALVRHSGEINSEEILKIYNKVLNM